MSSGAASRIDVKDDGYSEESITLQHILGGGPENVKNFFDTVWQVGCAVYSCSVVDIANDQSWNLERAQANPVAELVRQGWRVLVDLMDQEHLKAKRGMKQEDITTPLLFQNRSMVDLDDRTSKYGSAGSTETNLWAAILDGCSVVLNHVDLQSPWIALLCEDLQLSLPHAYANAYITPAGSQAVSAHADDRDVLIIQIYGCKQWTVYERIPVPYPYPHEQVGKDPTNPVPETVTKGPTLIHRILEPGDVLYMPRGYVHEARSCDDCCSFHVTVALATHDWSLTGLLISASQSVFSRQIEFRKAVDRHFGRRTDSMKEETVQHLQEQIEGALQLLRGEVTVENIDTALRNKYKIHNERAAAVRKPLLLHYSNQQTPAKSPDTVVGRAAAATVTLKTWLRGATEDEKAQLLQREQSTGEPPAQRGLHVREDMYEEVLHIIQVLKRPSSVPTGCQVSHLKSLLASKQPCSKMCDLTLLSLARRCVELGALAIHNPPA